jgi:hypothetical protein
MRAPGLISNNGLTENVGNKRLAITRVLRDGPKGNASCALEELPFASGL